MMDGSEPVDNVFKYLIDTHKPFAKYFDKHGVQDFKENIFTIEPESDPF